MTYIGNSKEAAFLAMLDGECVGSLRVCKRWQGSAFIDDLAVDRAHRGRGVGTMLMDAAVAWSKEKGLHGVSLETQDNNLLACRFYLKYGFKLGGIDQRLYDAHADYREEMALYFYLPPNI
jgi:ribosomal protein S18 acetylase RimI-like enzyme